MDIYVNPSLKDMSFSGGTCYETDGLRIVTGQHGLQGKTTPGVIFQFTFSGRTYVSLHGDERMYAAVRGALKDDLQPLAYSYLFQFLTGQRVRTLMDRSFMAGCQAGRADLQREIRQILDVRS